MVVVAGPGGPARLSWRPDYRPTILPGHTTLGYSALLYFILNWYISTDLLEFCMDCNTLYFFLSYWSILVRNVILFFVAILSYSSQI